MPPQTSMLHIRFEESIKNQATQTLDAMGWSMATAVRLFLHRVVAGQAFPLQLKILNACTRAAMGESRAMLAEPARTAAWQEQYNRQTNTQAITLHAGKAAATRRLIHT